MNADLIVIAKEPVPGFVKTRLTPPYAPEEAAALAEAALTDTLETVAASTAGARSLLLDGTPGRWLPPGVRVLPQRGDGLDERLAHAFEDAYAGRPLVLIGMDTPQVTCELLERAGEVLETRDAVLGPASDGGFWLIGLARPDAGLLRGVPMSRPDTGQAQLRRLREAGLDVAFMPKLNDVDTIDDVAEVATQAPDGRFAAAVRALPSAAARL